MSLRVWAMAIGLGLSAITSAAAAQSAGQTALGDPTTAEQARKAIARVNREIAELESMVLTRSSERAKLQTVLRDTDTAIATTNKTIDQIKRSIEELNRAINSLEADAVTLERDIASRQSQIEEALGAFSVLRQGGDLKILLGNSTAHEAERHQAYFDILLSNQLTQISAFKAAINALEDNQRVQETTRSDQQQARARLEDQRMNLLTQRKSQGSTITKLTALLERDGLQIKSLKEDSARLNTLLTELLRRIADLNLLGDFEDFASMAGSLRSPIKSSSKTRFGQKRDRGDLRWQGWLMPAKRGTPVRSIHFGRVVYADWLRGQGLLTIIDHGNGWMSLYGRNESLLKQTGDWVAPGEEIARVGSSGGATDPALYFEIRSDGTPVNPAKWIRVKR